MNTQTEAAAYSVPMVDTARRVPAWVMSVVRLLVIFLDAIAAAACFILAFQVREGVSVLSPTAWAWSRNFVPYSGILYFAVAVTLFALAYNGVYRFYGAFSFTQEFIKIFRSLSVSSLLIVAWAFLFRGGFAFSEFSYSRAVFLLNYVFSLIVFVSLHLGIRYIQTRVREREINLIPTIVVGTGNEAVRLIEELRRRRYLGFRVLGALRCGKLGSADNIIGGVDRSAIPILGSIDDLPDLIRSYKVREVIITDDSFESNRLFDAMLGVGRSHTVEFRFAPSVFNLLPQKTSVDQIGVLPMLRLFTEPLSDAQRFLKRASDIAVALIGLSVALPLGLVIATLIKRDSRGPIFFRQERVGMDGRIFLCLKFRSMYADADDFVHRETSSRNIRGETDANVGNNDKPVFGKVPNDPRVTRVGRWLRRYSLDELPQLVNVLRGDMSMVGPRPPIPYEVFEYDLRHRKRLDMKPGITGLWQVSGRNRLSFEEMVKVDLYYIENWSIWLDLKIILLTLPAIWRHDE